MTSTKYYTNVFRNGNFVFVREVNKGQRRKFKTEYKPTLYVTSPKESKFRSPDGGYVEPIQPGTMQECYRFIEKYKNVDGFHVFGNTQYEYSFLAEEYPGEIEYQLSDMVICNIDIEVASKGGFAKPDDPWQEVTAITLKNSKDGVFHVFACKWFENTLPEVKYYNCDDEVDMLEQFIKLWVSIEPDIVTGWNVRLYDIPYLVNRITRVVSEESAFKLSPWGHIKENTVNIFNKPHQVYDIAGVNVIDYLLIYRKNVLKPRESYRLDYIAQVELGERKVDYGEYGSLQGLFEGNFQKYVEYNIHDVRLVDRLDAKLKLIELQLIVAYDAKVNFSDVLSQVRVWDMKIANHLLANGVTVPQKEHIDKDTQFVGAFVMKPQVGLHEWVASFDVVSLYPTIMRTLNMGIETKIPDHKLTQTMKDYQAIVGKELIVEVADDDAGKSGAGTKVVNIDVVLDNLSEARIDEFIGDDVTVATNAAFYRREPQSFYSVMIEALFNNRVIYKKKAKEAGLELHTCTDPARQAILKDQISNFDLKQKATKIQLNSLYGAMGNQYFRFFDVQNAEAVTSTGQFIIQYVGQGLDSYLNKALKTKNKRYVIYSDTDSVYVTLAGFVKKYHPHGDVMEKCAFVDKICKEAIQLEINRLFAVITDQYLNGVGDYLQMNREVIGDKGIWTAKKRYLINVRDEEGKRYPIDKPELKVLGVEIAKATIPKFSREAMKEAIHIVMDKDQETLYTFIAETKKNFVKQAIEDVSFPRSVNNLEKYANEENIFGKGTPGHTKGALLYNALLKRMGLADTYPPINGGEKIRFCHLIEPNPYGVPVIAFPVTIPLEFGLDPYIDWEKQWTKAFIEPIKLILNAIKWDTVKRACIDSMFEDEEELPVVTPEDELPAEDDELGEDFD